MDVSASLLDVCEIRGSAANEVTVRGPLVTASDVAGRVFDSA